MDAELKRLHSPDIYDLENFEPSDPTCFGFLLQAMVGPKGLDGEESFDIEICSPKWLDSTYENDDVIIGRHLLIMKEYNYQLIFRTIEKHLRTCSGENWNDVGLKVSRLGKWEFEDYNEC